LGLKSLSYLNNQEGGVEEGGAEEGGAEEGGVEETGVGECGVEEGGAEECEAEESGVEECTRPRSTGRVAQRNLSSLCTRWRLQSGIFDYCHSETSKYPDLARMWKQFHACPASGGCLISLIIKCLIIKLRISSIKSINTSQKSW